MIKILFKRNLIKFSKRTFSNKPKTMPAAGLSLKDVVSALELFAPLETGEKWDNIGLLIEPYKERTIKKIILTNDLTEKSLDEAVSVNSDLIISYHPPIFAPLKQITQKNWKERIVSRCLAENIAVYSPHTSWDVALNGINDWLASALPIAKCQPIQPIPQMLNGAGIGRICSISKELTLMQAIEHVQKHIGLDVHVAMGINHTRETLIKTFAVCAGSGSSVLKGVKSDLYITGEMSHHELVDINHQNITVILCNHSNSERGFLREFKTNLHHMLNGECEIVVSESDKDPLITYSFNNKKDKN